MDSFYDVNFPDWFAVLGVPKDASGLDIRRAYMRTVLRTHPDRTLDPSPSRREEFHLAQEAYNILGDDERRSRYVDEVRVRQLREQRLQSSPRVERAAATPVPPRHSRDAETRRYSVADASSRETSPAARHDRRSPTRPRRHRTGSSSGLSDCSDHASPSARRRRSYVRGAAPPSPKLTDPDKDQYKPYSPPYVDHRESSRRTVNSRSGYASDSDGIHHRRRQPSPGRPKLYAEVETPPARDAKYTSAKPSTLRHRQGRDSSEEEVPASKRTRSRSPISIATDRRSHQPRSIASPLGRQVSASDRPLNSAKDYYGFIRATTNKTQQPVHVDNNKATAKKQRHTSQWFWWHKAFTVARVVVRFQRCPEIAAVERREAVEAMWKQEIGEPFPSQLLKPSNVCSMTVSFAAVTTRWTHFQQALERFSGEAYDWKPLNAPESAIQEGRLRLCILSKQSSRSLVRDVTPALWLKLNRLMHNGSTRPDGQDAPPSEDAQRQLRTSETEKTPVSEATNTKRANLSSRNADGGIGSQGFVVHADRRGTESSQYSPTSVLLCVPGSRRLLYSEINTTDCADDVSFFQAFRQHYNRLRGFARNWLSPRRFWYCHFVKVRRYHRGRIAFQNNELPPLERQEYVYLPKPPDNPYVPPISPEEWEMRFNGELNEPHSTSAFDLIPRRTDPFDIDNGDQRDDMWGLHAHFRFSFVGVVLYFCSITVPGLAFWIWWLAKHPGDWQTAVVPLMTTMVLLGGLAIMPLNSNFKHML